jgi:hypothetical protein
LIGSISDGDSGTMVLDTLVSAGSFITAVATDSVGNTSEFSPCAPVNSGTHSAWSGTGSGVVTVTDNGVTSGTPSMNYQNNGAPNFTGAWQFSTVATGSGTINLTYNWVGFHSFFQVTAGLDVFVKRGGYDVFVSTLIAAGPEDCGACNPPSGGFTYSGPANIEVQPGDTYGFRLRGSHFDDTYALQGTFSVAGVP